MHFLDYYLQRKTTSGNAPETTSTEVSLTDPGQTQMGKAEQFEGENTSHDEEMEGGWKKKEQPSARNGGGKRQKLTADDIDKQYLDSLKQTGQRMEETSSDCDRMFHFGPLPAMK